VSFKNKWIDFLYSVATGSRKFRNLLTPVGAILFGLFTMLFVVAALLVDKFLNLPQLFPKPLNITLSLPVILSGLFLMGWSAFQFLKVKGTPVPFNPPPRLVTSGPFAFVRNPMITGVFILLFGLGILLRSVSLVFLFTPLFILFNYWELKAIEEPELVKRLGDEYVDYRKQTPMFIPAFRLKSRTKR
jgi:protein-S-isoprenylcysteine O-methyltransferase Ste14